MQSNTTWLSTTNAVLFVLQAVVNVIYSKSLLKTPHQYETMIMPESFAFLIWILIYVLEAVVVVIDLVSPQYSVYADASQPSQLRTCFGFSCIANIAWVLLYVKHHVHLATLAILLLWLALLVLYIYTVNDRQLRSGRSSSIFQVGSQIDWWQYICSELPFALYFAWVTALVLSHLAISLQQHRQTFLPIAVYVLHLSILIIMALVTLHYAHDPIFSLVIIWFLSAIATKSDRFPNEFKTLDASVKACAAEGVEVIAGLLVISALIMMFMDRKYDHAHSGMGLPVVETSAADYGSNRYTLWSSDGQYPFCCSKIRRVQYPLPDHVHAFMMLRCLKYGSPTTFTCKSERGFL